MLRKILIKGIKINKNLSHTYMNITKIDKYHRFPLYQFNKGCISFFVITMSMNIFVATPL